MADDYTVIWDGSSKRPLPQPVVRDAAGDVVEDDDSRPVVDGWTQRHGSYLTEAADYEGVKRYGDLPTAREMIGKTTLTGLQIRTVRLTPLTRCACGRALTELAVESGRTRCWRCQNKRRSLRKQVA